MKTPGRLATEVVGELRLNDEPLLVRRDSDGDTAAAAILLLGISKRSSQPNVGRGSSSADDRGQGEVAGASGDLHVVASCGVLVAGTLKPYVAAQGAEGLIVEG